MYKHICVYTYTHAYIFTCPLYVYTSSYNIYITSLALYNYKS